jgi:hypothetical protein
MTRAFLLTNLNTDLKPLKFRVPLDIIGPAIEQIGWFPYAPGERVWDGKTLFIKGTKSKYINHHNIPIAKEFFPSMRTEELDAGHWGTLRTRLSGFACLYPLTKNTQCMQKGGLHNSRICMPR